MVIGYDVGRGEPRGKIRRGDTEERGDCIDCNRCVVVCPTGIDIRNGLQMECIGCAACVDACDEVMRKVERPEGLIRYDSSRRLRGEERRSVHGRFVLLGGVALVWALAMGLAVRTHAPFEANLLRPPGGAPFVVSDGVVQNTLQVHLVNKDDQELVFRIEDRSAAPLTLVIPHSEIRLAAGEGRYVPLLARVPVDRMSDLRVSVGVSVDGGEPNEERLLTAPLLGPERAQ